jgi:hypothetical protein
MKQHAVALMLAGFVCGFTLADGWLRLAPDAALFPFVVDQIVAFATGLYLLLALGMLVLDVRDRGRS